MARGGGVEILSDIDSENKRRSVASQPWSPVLPVPDSSITVLDRIHIAGYYAGITPQSPAAGNRLLFGLENGEYTTLFGGAVIR